MKLITGFIELSAWPGDHKSPRIIIILKIQLVITYHGRPACRHYIYYDISVPCTRQTTEVHRLNHSEVSLSEIA